MDAKLKKLAVALVLMAVLLSCIIANTEVVYSDNAGGEIDLFTQRDPYSGKGPDMPSDAFSLGEEVEIYALVTYNECPVPSLLVAFEVIGPENPVENLTFCRVAITNETGMAMMSFRMPHSNETAFGEWTAIGNTKIGDLTFQDSVSFKVDWIVEIVSIDTMDENYTYQERFTRKSHIRIDLGLRNIAMTEKKVTLSVAIHDHLGFPLDSTEIIDFKLQPDGVPIHAYCLLLIPEDACIGEATVRACAYTAPPSLGGVPYSPERSKNFFITNRDTTILSVQPYPTVVYQGETVNIDVVVRNGGWEIEFFNVSIYYNETFIDLSPVLNLQPRSNATVSFIWNTSQIEEGLYRISAYAEPVPFEIDDSDNTFVNGFVEVRAPVHDIAILSVTPSSEIAYIGDILDINVTVKNEGNFVESFNVTVFYDSDVVGVMLIDSLMPNWTETLVYHWNIDGVPKGNYTLSAEAEQVTGEEDADDNFLEDGVVEVRIAPAGWFVPWWFWWLLLFLLILVLILLIIWLYLRRKRKKAEGTFYSGWTAWYYCYDLRKRTSKT